MKSTPDEEGRRIVEEDLKRYMPLTAPALARASGTSFRAGEVPVAGRKTLFHFTSLHFTSPIRSVGLSGCLAKFGGQSASFTGPIIVSICNLASDFGHIDEPTVIYIPS
jgi:hypothetical protein